MVKKAASKKGGQLNERLSNFLASARSLSLTDWGKVHHDPKLLHKAAAPLEVDLSGWQSAIKAYRKKRKKSAWNRQKPVEYNVDAVRKEYEIHAEILRKQGILDEVKRKASIHALKKKISKD